MIQMGVVIRTMRVDDIVDVKGVDLLSWTDLMERTYGVKVKLSPRTDENILSYLRSDPEGVFVASDEFAGVIGVVFSHVWGATGWVGPLSVLPMYQTRGLGKDLLKRSLTYLEDMGCVDIGLETMPESAVNLGLYFRVGLRPECLVLVLDKKLEKEGLQEEPVGGVAIERFSESSVQEKMMSELRRISGALRLGLDYTKEIELTQEFGLGDTIVATSRNKVMGFCVVQTKAKRENLPGASVRVVAVDPAAKEDVLEPLLVSAELLAVDAGTEEISLAMPAQCRRALDVSFSRGYSVAQSFERLMWMGSSGVGERTYNLCTWSG
ncbi:MAG TPA: N-acetyltransferase [Thermoplasmata archaeon]|nr:N-acetyltransferase [Thermoplasmata archaeon]